LFPQYFNFTFFACDPVPHQPLFEANSRASLAYPSNMRVRENQCLYFQLSTTAFSFMQPIFSQPQALLYHLRINSTQAQVTFRAGFTRPQLPFRITASFYFGAHQHHIPISTCAVSKQNDVTLQTQKKHHAFFFVPMICARERE
jgi:hypothetical protein